MPRADYTCPDCGSIQYDHVFAVVDGARASAPYCVADDCMRPLMIPIPGCRFDLTTDGEGGRAQQKFTVHRQIPTRDGLVQVEEVIDSAHARRRIERDSEQRYRDGEGEPLRFRADHQTASNMDRNSFGVAGRIGDVSYDSGQQPQKKQNISTRRHGERKPRIGVARGAGQTALKG